MNLLKKIISFFIKVKTVTVGVYANIDKFIKEHRKQIKLLMTILEAIFPAKTGSKKMACVISNVCMAVGLEEYTEDVLNYVQEKCQAIYDELKGVNEVYDSDTNTAPANEIGLNDSDEKGLAENG